MSKQTDIEDKRKPVEQSSPQQETSLSPEAQVTMPDMASSALLGGGEQSPIQNQATQLNNSSIPLFQRQMMASRMANSYGNQHMAHVMDSVQRKQNGNQTGVIQERDSEEVAPTEEENGGFFAGNPLDFLSSGTPEEGDDLVETDGLPDDLKEQLDKELASTPNEVDVETNGDTEEEEKNTELETANEKPIEDFSETDLTPTPNEALADLGEMDGAVDAGVGVLESNQDDIKGGNEEGLAETTARVEEAAGNRDEMAGKVSDSQSDLSDTLAGVEETASAETKFAPVEEEESELGEEIISRRGGDDDLDGGEGDTTAQRAAAADAMIGQFVSNSTVEIGQIGQLAQTIPSRLQPMAEESKSVVQSSVEENKSLILAAIEQVRGEVMAEAEVARGEVEAKHGETVGNIQAKTTETRTSIETSYTTKSAELMAMELAEMTKVSQLFDDKAKAARDVGTAKGEEALKIGKDKQDAFKQETPPEPPSDGAVADFFGDLYEGLTGDTYGKNWTKAKVDAAKKVSEKYKQEMIAKAEETATQITNGKQEAISQVEKTVADMRTAMEQEKTNALKQVEQDEKDAIASADQTKESHLKMVEQTLTSTLDNLASMEVDLPTQIEQAGEEQKLSIDSATDGMISGIQDSINQNVDDLLAAVQDMQSQLSSVEAPDPDEFSGLISEAEGQLADVIDDAFTSVEEQITVAGDEILELGSMAVEALNQQTDDMIESVLPLSEGFATSMEEILTAASEAFKGVEDNYTESTRILIEQVEQHFTDLFDLGKGELDNIHTTLETQLGQAITDLSTSLDGSLQKEAGDIDTEAKTAADKVQPSWKRFVSFVLTIIITVIVAVAIAALVASGIGFVAGLLIAAAIGAVAGVAKQMLTNWSTGEEITKDLVKAAIVGAIDGALQFAGGRYIKGLTASGALVEGTFKTVAYEAVKNSAIGTVTQTVDLAISGNLTWGNFGKVVFSNVVGGAFNMAGGAALNRAGLGGSNLSLGQQFGKAGIDIVAGTAGGTLGDADLLEKAINGELTWADVGDSARKNLTSNVISSGLNMGMDRARVKDRLTDGINDRLPDSSSTSSTTTNNTDTEESTTTNTTPDTEETTATTTTPDTEETTTTTRPDVEETTTVTPDVEETTTVTPDVEETTTTRPDVEETTTVTPDVEETTTVTPDVEETTTVTPDVEETTATTVTPDGEESTTTSKTPDDILDQYINQLDGNEGLAERLYEINDMPDGPDKAVALQQLEVELQQNSQNQTTQSDLSGEQLLDQHLNQLDGNEELAQRLFEITAMPDSPDKASALQQLQTDLTQGQYGEDLKNGNFSFLTMSGQDAADPNGITPDVQAYADAHGLTEAELAAIRIYTAQDYAYINPSLADIDGWLDFKVQQLINDGEWNMPNQPLTDDQRTQVKAESHTHTEVAVQGMDKLPNWQGEVYRGMGLTQDEFNQMFPLNGETSFPSFTSTSTDQGVSGAFAAMESAGGKVGVLLVMNVKNGKDVNPISYNAGEDEILLPPNASFTVTKIEPQPDGTQIVYLDEN